MEHGIRKIVDRVDLMRLAREAQNKGCWSTAEAILRELGRRGAPALELAA